MQIVEGIIGVASIASILVFLIFVVGLSRMPTNHRPKTRTLDRYGNEVQPQENPGYRETENEHHS